MRNTKNISKGELISILMPIKNEEKYLEECLDSIVNQTETNWELIGVDDHSSDSCSGILRKYCKADSRIRAYKNKGTGIIEALRTAYSYARGTILTRMDADDVMMPEKLSCLKSNILKHGDGHVAIGGVEYFSNGELGNGYIKYAKWLNGLTATGSNYSEVYKECVVPSPCWMTYKKDFESCGGFLSDNYPEDYDLCFRYYKYGLKVIPSKNIIHKWRDYPERSSRVLADYSDNSFLTLKMHYFIDIDFKPSKTLILWGASKKGKAVARLLVNRRIEFLWICNNHNRVGRDIYEVRIQGINEVDAQRNCQILILVANPDDQNNIRKNNLVKERSNDVYFFC